MYINYLKLKIECYYLINGPYIPLTSLEYRSDTLKKIKKHFAKQSISCESYQKKYIIELVKSHHM